MAADSSSTVDDDSHPRGGFSVLRIPPRYVVGLLALIGLALLPFGISTIDILTITGAFYFVIFVISWDYVSGYTGQMSFGHTFFFALGGYGSALLNLNFEVEPILSISIGVLLAGIGGLMMGLLSMRTRGNYLVLVTLIIPLIMLQIFIVYSDIFGGGGGLRQPDVLLQLDSFEATAQAHYYLAFLLFIVIFGIAFLITRSNTGKVFTGIREDQETVAASGISPARYKLFAFVTSGIFGGIGGAFLVHTPVGAPAPNVILAITIMIQILLASIVGGLGTLTGPTVGGFLIYFLQEWLGGVDYIVPVVNLPIAQADTLLFYLIIVVFLFYLPEGLVPWLVSTGRRITNRLQGVRGDAMTDGGRTEPPIYQILASLRKDMVEIYDDVAGEDSSNREMNDAGRKR